MRWYTFNPFPVSAMSFDNVIVCAAQCGSFGVAACWLAQRIFQDFFGTRCKNGGRNALHLVYECQSFFLKSRFAMSLDALKMSSFNVLRYDSCSRGKFHLISSSSLLGMRLAISRSSLSSSLSLRASLMSSILMASLISFASSFGRAFSSGSMVVFPPPPSISRISASSCLIESFKNFASSYPSPSTPTSLSIGVLLVDHG